MKNQLRWNCIPNEELRKQEWYMVIINSDNREVGRIQSKILKELASIEEIRGISGRENGLYYQISRIITERTEFQVNLTSTYKGNIFQDRDLYERQKIGFDGIEAYVTTALERDRF